MSVSQPSPMVYGRSRTPLPSPLTPDERQFSWGSTLFMAVQFYTQRVNHPDDAVAERSAQALFDLEKTRLRHNCYLSDVKCEDMDDRRPLLRKESELEIYAQRQADAAYRARRAEEAQVLQQEAVPSPPVSPVPGARPPATSAEVPANPAPNTEEETSSPTLSTPRRITQNTGRRPRLGSLAPTISRFTDVVRRLVPIVALLVWIALFAVLARPSARAVIGSGERHDASSVPRTGFSEVRDGAGLATIDEIVEGKTDCTRMRLRLTFTNRIPADFPFPLVTPCDTLLWRPFSMLTFWGNRHRNCDRLDRRNFLTLGAFGAGLTLVDQLRAASPGTAQPSLATPKSAIMIYLPGGPSHIDMYDPKPDAPAEFRGEFKAISTAVPGVQICEHMPMQARMFDKLAVVRSLVSTDEHSDSLVMTGFSEQVNRTAGHPSFGAVMSKLRTGNDDVPAFVSLRGMSLGTEPGYLGVAHRPFTPDGGGRENLRAKFDSTRMGDRKDLLSRFDVARRDIDATGTMKGLDAFTTRAFDMIASGTVRKALDLKQEDPRTVDRYKGVEQFLTTRRLIEAGVGCVTLSYGGWDTHSSNFKTLKNQLPNLDRGIGNLILDLDDRGLLDDTVVVVWGEFGRTPKINGSDAGRDHWSPVMSAMVAGGGLKVGQAIGASSARAEYPKDRPYKVPQLLSTLYRAVGIDPSVTFPNGSGRPMYVLDEREPVTELL